MTRLNPVDREIIRVLYKAAGKPISTAEIGVQAGVSRGTVLRTLRRLRGIVNGSGPGGRTPHIYTIDQEKLPEKFRSELQSKNVTDDASLVTP